MLVGRGQIVCVFISTTFAVAALAVRIDAVEIDLRANAQVAEGLVRLADVAAIDDADPSTKRQLGAVSLGPSPAAGRKFRITQQALRQRLLAHGANLSEIEFTGHSVVVIETSAEMSPEKNATEAPRTLSQPIAVRPLPVSPILRKKADDIVQRAFHRQYHAAETNVGPLTLNTEIADDDLAFLLEADPERLRFVEAGLMWGGPQTLTAQFSQRDGTTRVIRMEAWLNETPQILTVKHTVPKGRLLTEKDLTLVAAKQGETGVNQSQDLVGQETTRDLRPGQPIQSRDVTKAPLVRSNDLVTVRIRSPGLTVGRVFRATSTGGMGDVVNLTALENPTEKLQATVTGWHEAEVKTPVVSDPAESAAAPRSARRRPTADADIANGGGK